METAIQLWSLNDVTKEYGLEYTLKTVAKHGYDGVEFAGFGNIEANDMKRILKENNLYSVGAHTGLNAFKNEIEKNLEYNRIIGSEYMVISGVATDSEEKVKDVIDVLNRAAELGKKYDIKVGYHNHSNEFDDKIGDKTAWETIAENTSDDVIMELDVFWAVAANFDPYELIEKWCNKIELVHLKQIDANKENVLCSEGIIDFRRVASLAINAKHFVVEHEGEYDQAEASRLNAIYIKSL